MIWLVIIGLVTLAVISYVVVAFSAMADDAPGSTMGKKIRWAVYLVWLAVLVLLLKVYW